MRSFDASTGKLYRIMKWQGILVLLFLTVSAHLSRGEVVELTDLNFDERVTKRGDRWFIDVYAPW